MRQYLYIYIYIYIYTLVNIPYPSTLFIKIPDKRQQLLNKTKTDPRFGTRPELWNTQGESYSHIQLIITLYERPFNQCLMIVNIFDFSSLEPIHSGFLAEKMLKILVGCFVLRRINPFRVI